MQQYSALFPDILFLVRFRKILSRILELSDLLQSCGTRTLLMMPSAGLRVSQPVRFDVIDWRNSSEHEHSSFKLSQSYCVHFAD